MPPILRPYYPAEDFQRVNRFLIRHYQPQNHDGNWLQPAWAYMHSHPYLDRSALERIGIWEADGEIAAVATYESVLGEAFFQLSPGAAHLKPALLEYAEARLAAPGGEALHIFIPDFDAEFTALAQARGYRRLPEEDRGMLHLRIPQPFPPIHLTQGFRLQSLAEENDLGKIDRVLWRGFNHPGEPPAGGEEDRRQMQAAHGFRHNLNMVAVAPDGNYAAYAGLWHQAENRYAYVEPVATDPDYRRLGLASAAVLEGIRRCAAEGATCAYVGNDLPVYRSIGFEPAWVLRCWSKA